MKSRLISEIVEWGVNKPVLILEGLFRPIIEFELIQACACGGNGLVGS